MMIGASCSSWVILHLFFSSPLHVNQKEDAKEIRSATMLYVATTTSAIVKCIACWWPELVEANSDGATFKCHSICWGQKWAWCRVCSYFIGWAGRRRLNYHFKHLDILRGQKKGCNICGVCSCLITWAWRSYSICLVLFICLCIGCQRCHRNKRFSHEYLILQSEIIVNISLFSQAHTISLVAQHSTFWCLGIIKQLCTSCACVG